MDSAQGASFYPYLFEALFIAFLGGLLGCAAAMRVNGLTTGTLNYQRFLHLAFAFQITPKLLGIGVLFALLMGLVGGVPLAIRAARRPVVLALREP